MSLSVIGKFSLGAFSIVGSATAATVASIYLSNPMVDIYATSKSIPAGAAGVGNIKFHLSKDKSKSGIFALKSDVSSNHTSKKYIATSSFDKTNITEITADSYYKITTNKNIWDAWNENHSQKIEVYDSDSKKLSPVLTPLFMVYKNEIYKPYKTGQKSIEIKYFVGSVKQVEGTTNNEVVKSTTSSKNYECIDKYGKSEDCKIYEFTSNNAPLKEITNDVSTLTQNFKKTTDVAKKLVKDGFYLIEWTSEPAFVSNSENKTNKMVIKDLKPAIIVDDILFMVW